MVVQNAFRAAVGGCIFGGAHNAGTWAAATRLPQHATAHYHKTAHPVLQSLEPGEGWFYDYRTEQFGDGPELAQPHAHPANQPVPGPYGRVPRDWRAKLHQ